MILEGIVTTIGADGEVNVAPMGPQVDDLSAGPWRHFVLRPFRTSRTYANLRGHGEGVLHVTDDVLLLARAALGHIDPPPPLMPASHVRGFVLADACRAYEFRITHVAADSDRAELRAEVVHEHRLRDFFGFNRGMFAVLEAAILATRIALLPIDHILSEYQRLSKLVDKTGGTREHQAFDLLLRHVEQHRQTTI